MHISDYFNGKLTDEELYFKQLHDRRPLVYNDPLYSLFGHIFTSTMESSSHYLNENMEQANRLFATPLPERSFENLNAAKACSVVFSRHLRYVPSRFHSHEYFEIVYQHSGVSHHNINGTEITAKSGDLIILPPYTFHSIISPYKDSLTVNIGVKLSDFSVLYGEFLQQSCILSTFLKNCIEEKKTYDYMLIKTAPPSALGDVILNALMIQENAASSGKLTDFSVLTYLQSAIFQLFSLLFMHYPDSGFAMPRTNKNTNTLVSIMYYLKSNYRYVDLSKLARDFHFTEPYLSRMIKSGTGHTFSKLLSSVRLNTSLLMLENTRLPVADIANLVGYKAPENYMRNFKSVYNVTPTEYRKAKTNLKRTASP